MSPLLIGQDPEWANDVSRRWGNALSATMEIINQKKAREEREVERQIQYLARFPELADTLGADMVRKWGRKRPEIVSLVGTLQEQNKLQKESERSYGLYEKAYSDEVTRRQAFQQGVEGMPEEMAVPVTPWGDTATVPNTAKMYARSQMATLPDPAWSAYQGMDPEKRLAATVAMRQNKIDIPKPPETLGPKDLSQVQRDLEALGYTVISPERQTAGLAQAGVIERPAAVTARAEAAKQKEIEDARRVAEQIAGEQRRAGLQTTTHQQNRLFDVAHPLSQPSDKDKKAAEKQTNKDVHAAISTYLNPRVEGTKERAQAKSDITSEPPPAMPVYDQATIKNAIRKQVEKGIPADEAAQLTIHAYDGMTAEGMNSADIRKELTQMTEGFGIVESGKSMDPLSEYMASAKDEIRAEVERQLKTKSREEVWAMIQKAAAEVAAKKSK